MNIKKLSLIMMSCFLANAYAYIPQSNTPFLAGGISTFTTNIGKQSSPLLAYEDNQTWNVASIPANFPKEGNIGVNAITCTKTTCLALIMDQSSTKPAASHIFISKDKGKSWQNNPNIAGLPKLGAYMFDSIKCLGNTCIIIGVSELNNNHPFTLTSTDAGLRWTYHNVAAEDNLPVLRNKLACNKDFCVSAGNKRIGFNKQSPYLMVSDNTYTKWNRVANIQNLPTNLDLSDMSSASCSDTGCTVVGFDMFDDNGFPIIITSHDQGTTWSYVTQIDNFPAGGRASLSSVHCTDSTCMAVGGYKVNDFMYPLVIRSTDGGYHWGVVSAVIAPVGISSLFDVTCDAINSNVCVSVGEGNDGLLIITSKDNGVSWASVDNSKFPTGKMLSLDSVECKNARCAAVGFNESHTGTIQPVLLSSGDNISTWTAVTLNGLSSGVSAASLYTTGK